jgi:RNA polymerase sigma-70 factor, ECF subfamily
MSTSIAEHYAELFKDDQPGLLALLACSAALQLDDETACEVVKLVANTNGSTRSLVWRIKKLGCVWKEWNGLWRLTEDVRRQFHERLHKELAEAKIVQLREHLIQKAASRAQQTDPHDDMATQHQLLTRLEAIYQGLQIPARSNATANQLVELWRRLAPTAAEALARSVDHLGDELDQRLPALPDAVLLLRGIAARARDDVNAQEKYFGRVWRRARRATVHEDHAQPGYIGAMAAYYSGQLFQHRDPITAEKALRDSLKWIEAGRERGLVYLSLATLLSTDPKRRDEVEQAFNQSLESLSEPADKAKVHLALAAWLNNPAIKGPSQSTSHDSLEQKHQVSEPWTTEVEIPLEEFRASIQEEMYQFASGYLRDPGSGKSAEIGGLMGELRRRFFTQKEIVWEEEAQFVGDAAHVSRRIIVNHARTHYSTKLNQDRHAEWLKKVEEFGNEPEADLLALDDALNQFQKISPDHVRLVEFRFYAGMTVEETAKFLRMPEQAVEREWSFAKAFLKNELMRAKSILQQLDTANLMNTGSIDQQVNRPFVGP